MSSSSWFQTVLHPSPCPDSSSPDSYTSPDSSSQSSFSSRHSSPSEDNDEQNSVASAPLSAPNYYPCTMTGCQKIFKHPSALRTHLPTHTGEKAFQCSYPDCSKSFNVKSNLNRHYSRHSSVRKSPTPVPKRKAATPLPENERPTCPFCPNKTFSQKCNLRVHLRLHTGTEEFRCNMFGCDKVFNLKSNLSRHQRNSHPPAPPISEFAPDRFPRSSQMVETSFLPAETPVPSTSLRPASFPLCPRTPFAAPDVPAQLRLSEQPRKCLLS
ncbi:hypothetical protein C8J56DRAFT_1038191 [Mycena floridula]|nr:hypothetical protein C8J56DRAFT_1038191 [Mycena floridula]